MNNEYSEELLEELSTDTGYPVELIQQIGDDFDTDADELADVLAERILWTGTLDEYAEYLVYEAGALGEIPEALASYIDHKAFAHDLRCSGEVSEYVVSGYEFFVVSNI
jgi:hypothetical protein